MRFIARALVLLRKHKDPNACPWPRALWARRRVGDLSPLTLRILAVNVFALAILVGSLLYLGRYQDRLIAAELDGLLMQGRLSASAVAEGAVVLDRNERNILSPLLARLMIRRLVEATETRTRLFDEDHTLIADSRILTETSGKVQARKLPGKPGMGFVGAAMRFFDFLDRLFQNKEYPVFSEDEDEGDQPQELLGRAQTGDATAQVWRMPDGGLLLSVAVPVQRYKQVLGTVVLTRPDTKIDASIRAVRIDILNLFFVSLLITVLMSFYLARAIATPLNQLARAAETVRTGQSKAIGLSGTSKFLNRDVIPDFSERQDEIGDLSVALREMTSALAGRIRAIETFAADVAHELKNPLTSLRSAVETVQKVSDPERQAKLMAVIRDDVDRMDRLISDISNASRLDAELTRDQAVELDVTKLLETMVDFYAQERGKEQPRAAVRLDPPPPKGLIVPGVEGRLVQVMQNLIENALSFAPPDSVVAITARLTGADVEIVIEDCGGGIPENKLDAIFDRFYSERPRAEKFGTHSGLGLSISRQIIEAHHGRIWAENRKDEQGTCIGARFIVRLPVVSV